MALYLAATGGLAIILAIVTIVDIKRMVIPDWANACLLLLGVVSQTVLFEADLVWVASSVLALGGLFWAVRYLHRRATGRIGLGMGDVKMAAAAGAWVGLGAIPSFLLFSSVSALLAALGLRVFKRAAARDRLPFGPFLAAGLLACWLTNTLPNTAISL